MVNIKSVVTKLQKHYPDAVNVAVVDRNGKILFTIGKWDIKKDIKEMLAKWASGNAQFVTLSGIRYSILQMEPERFIGTNRKKQGHLIGASTPDGKIYMLAHIRPKAKGWFHMAYPAVARAAAMLKKGSESEFIETKVKLEEEVSESVSGQAAAYQVTPPQPTIDPYLKAEIEGFLQWITNPQGLGAYISNILQQNDQNRISKLAELYNKLYHLFYD
ncbi:MAG: hypothetical protein R3255_10640 [Candidatus Lokiarchaeia archaeon]|nr:hypothetical protein [Candidatus Lokiarchaeia archaeon]